MKLAIVGTGISGLVCAHLLQRDHELTVFEANGWIGGHTNTVPVALGDCVFPVDTGFIVFNRTTYPNFVKLLDELSVESQLSDMSFGVRCDRSGLEYATYALGAVFAQRRNLLRPAFHRMLRDIGRFHREARALLEHPDEKLSLGDFLCAGGYGKEFVDWHLVPMGAAIWSAEPVRMLDFPAAGFVRFFANHGLLQRRGAPPWRVIRGGSQSYVERLTLPFRDRIRLKTPALSVRRTPDAVEVATREGAERFDQVILATHSDQSLALLHEPTPAERRVLGAIDYQENEALLHTDVTVLPRRRAAWASWNYRVPRAPRDRVAVTYHMNRLQSLDAPEEFLVTLNDAEAIDPRRVIASFTYHHPVFDARAMQAQRHHAEISGADRIHFCGAYWGWGFHEDGVRSALSVARAFGAEL